MKIKSKILIPLLLCLLAAASSACSEKEEVQQTAPHPVILNGEVFSIGSEVGTVWSGGQAVGVYMLKSGSQEIVGNYANVKYLADNRGATGYLVPADNVPMYLPEDGSTVDIRAYYPYSAEVTAAATRAGKPHALQVEVNENTKPDGFLYSQSGSSLGFGQTSTTLRLASILAAIKINFICSVEGAYSISALLRNMPNQGTFDLIKGRFTQYSSSGNNELPMTGNKTQNTGNVSFGMQAILLPGQLDEGAQLAVAVCNQQGDTIKKYTPVELHQVLDLQEQQMPGNTQFDVAAQLTENSEIETQLVGTSSICILNWTGGDEEPEGGIARPDSK